MTTLTHPFTLCLRWKNLPHKRQGIMFLVIAIVLSIPTTLSLPTVTPPTIHLDTQKLDGHSEGTSISPLYNRIRGWSNPSSSTSSMSALESTSLPPLPPLATNHALRAFESNQALLDAIKRRNHVGRCSQDSSRPCAPVREESEEFFDGGRFGPSSVPLTSHPLLDDHFFTSSASNSDDGDAIDGHDASAEDHPKRREFQEEQLASQLKTMLSGQTTPTSSRAQYRQQPESPPAYNRHDLTKIYALLKETNEMCEHYAVNLSASLPDQAFLSECKKATQLDLRRLAGYPDQSGPIDEEFVARVLQRITLVMDIVNKIEYVEVAYDEYPDDSSEAPSVSTSVSEDPSFLLGGDLPSLYLHSSYGKSITPGSSSSTTTAMSSRPGAKKRKSLMRKMRDLSKAIVNTASTTLPAIMTTLSSPHQGLSRIASHSSLASRAASFAGSERSDGPVSFSSSATADTLGQVSLTPPSSSTCAPSTSSWWPSLGFSSCKAKKS